jgi:uncharacterized protein (DUF2237 family)
LNQLENQKSEVAGSRADVQALKMESGARVVGPDAPTANSKTVKPGLHPNRTYTLPTTRWEAAKHRPGCPQSGFIVSVLP